LIYTYVCFVEKEAEVTENITRERLLDAAEELIAAKGYGRTSLRDVTSAAGANLAAVNYHFGSKAGLAEAVLKRHMVPLNEQRLALLDEELAAARKEQRLPDVDTLVRILMGPVLRHIRTEAHGQRFVRIFSRLHTDPDETLRNLVMQNIQKILNPFFKAFSQALPHLPRSILFARMVFSFGTMGHAANLLCEGSLGTRAHRHGMPALPDAENFFEELIGYVSHGMKMPCQQEDARAREVKHAN
jgi:AcrR family transcriptional regulator